MKPKKIFLSLGILAAIGAPTIAVVSCLNGEDGKDGKDGIDNYQPKNISKSELIKMGGLAGDKAKENNYALIKDFVFSLTSENGKIFLTINKAIKLISSKSLKKFKEGIKKIRDNSQNLVKVLVALHSKGINLSEDDFKSINKIIFQFVEESPSMSYYAKLVRDVFSHNGLKDFIEKSGTPFDLIKKLVGPIFDSLETLVNNLIIDGFAQTPSSKKYYDHIIEKIKDAINPMLTNGDVGNTNLQKAIGLGETPTLEKSLLKVLIENVFVEVATWKTKELSEIENNKEDIKANANSPSKKELLKNYLDGVINRAKSVSNHVVESSVPLFHGKGLLKLDKDEFKKSLLFLQSLLQKFLLYFGTSQEITKGTWKSNIDKTIDDMVSLVNDASFTAKNLQVIKENIESLTFKPVLWRIATMNLEKHSDTMHKLIYKKLNLIDFKSKETNDIFKFVSYLVNKKEPPTFSSNESNTLLDMLLHGLNKGANNKKEHAKSAIGKIIKMIDINADWGWVFIKDMIFGD